MSEIKSEILKGEHFHTVVIDEQGAAFAIFEKALNEGAEHSFTQLRPGYMIEFWADTEHFREITLAHLVGGVKLLLIGYCFNQLP